MYHWFAGYELYQLTDDAENSVLLTLLSDFFVCTNKFKILSCNGNLHKCKMKCIRLMFSTEFKVKNIYHSY